MSVMTDRHHTIAATMAVVRRLNESLGPTDELIEALKPVLVELSERGDLFPQETFAVTPGGTMTIYEVSCDPGRKLGLYASAGLPGKYQPPHDHRTWSLIAGVRGAEHNKYFERTTGGDDFAEATLAPRGELTLRQGVANGMLGDKFHAIEVIDEGPALHLHLYGDTLDSLQGRIFYESELGGVAKPFMSKPDLHTARVSEDELANMGTDGGPLTVINTSSRESMAGNDKTDRIVVVSETEAEAHARAHEMRRAGHLNVAILAGGI